MCGRYSLSVLHKQIHCMVDYPDIDVAEAEWIDEDVFRPRYNIAPRSSAPVIRRKSPNDGELVIHTMKWGVVPHWSKYEDLTLNTINARAENLVESGGMWNSMKGKKRCVVVCDGYFEWLKKGKDRLPHFIRRKDGKLMILAGLYDSVVLEGDTTRNWTFTIVTTNAAPSFSWLHDRQPVILLSTADFEAWLDTSKGWHMGLISILTPGDGKELECYPVPKEVGRVGSNSPDFIRPVSQRKDGIEAMFVNQAAKSRQTPSGSPSKETPSAAAMLSAHNLSTIPANRNDGTTSKHVVEIDASPPSSPSPGTPSNKKRKFSHSSDAKRPVEPEAGDSLRKKRPKIIASGEVGTRKYVPDNNGQGPDQQYNTSSHDFRARCLSEARGSVKTSSPSKSVPKSNDGSDERKITAFFRPQI